MKLIKTASGKQTLKMSKKEWENIGEKTGWIKKAGKVSNIVMGLQRGIIDPQETAQLLSLLNSAYKMNENVDPTDLEAIINLSSFDENQATDPSLIQSIILAKNIASRYQNQGQVENVPPPVQQVQTQQAQQAQPSQQAQPPVQQAQPVSPPVQQVQPVNASNKTYVKESKKESKTNKKKPTEHGFMDQCIKENKDKDDPGAYCASIVDKVKGTTDWRKGPKK